MYNRKDMTRHAQHCLYQFINCELCNTRLLLRDLVTHQKVKRCHEKQIMRERIEHNKMVHHQMVTHFRQLHSATAGRHVAYRKYMKAQAHKKIGWTPPVPSVWTPDEQRVLTPKLLTHSPLKQQLELGLDLGRLAELTTADSDAFNHAVPLLSDRSQFYEQGRNYDEFIYVPDQRAPPASARTPNEGPSICVRCNKVFRTRSNNEASCRWHQGVSSTTSLFE